MKSSSQMEFLYTTPLSAFVFSFYINHHLYHVIYADDTQIYMSTWKHISQTCRACFYHIRDLCRIRKILSLDLAKQIAVALDSSNLHYCNSLFHNMRQKDITRLQRVQNSLARLVTKAPRFGRSTPILKRLPVHWLPGKFHIYFKICALTFRNPKRQPTCISGWLTYSAELLNISSLHKFK